MSLEDEKTDKTLEEQAEEIIETTSEIAQMMIEDLIFDYRPKTGNIIWVMYALLKEKREKEGSDWVLVRNPFGWFHIVRTQDLPLLVEKGYSEVSITKGENHGI